MHAWDIVVYANNMKIQTQTCVTVTELSGVFCFLYLNVWNLFKSQFYFLFTVHYGIKIRLTTNNCTIELIIT
jgi:hypothetical protein